MKWIEAAQRGNVRELLNHFAEGQKVNAEDENGFTALGVAVEQGHAKAVKELLMMGADPKSGGAPYFAIDANRVEILRLLLEHGLNPNGSMRGMGSFIDKAVQVAARPGKARDKDACLKLLSKAGADKTKVQRAMEAAGLSNGAPAKRDAKTGVTATAKPTPRTPSKTKSKKATKPRDDSDPIERGPAADRRGTLRAWDYDSWTAMSVFVGGKNGLDAVADALAKAGATVRSDVTKAALSGKLARPRGRYVLIAKLKGHDWAPMSANWGDEWSAELHQQLSHDARTRLIWCAHQDTAGATAFHLYDKGKLAIQLESVGKYDGETRFKSASHPKNWWRQHDDENEMLQALVREQDAYVPKVYVQDEDGTIEFETIPSDALEPEHVERIVLAEYAATPDKRRKAT